MGRRCTVFIMLLFISCLHGAFGYSSSVAECGSPTNPKFTSGTECSGCAFSALDMNTFNKGNNDKGCVAALSGMYAGSSAAKGYHCHTVRTTSSGVSCSVHRTCGSKNAADSSTKSCIYTMGGFSGISKTADCPADEVCNGGTAGNGAVAASGASSRRCTVFIMLLFISCLHGAFGYSSSVAECGSPSNPKFTSGTECSGCAFSALDINTFNTANNDKGCVAALSGMYAGSSAAKGYHCLTVRTTSSGVTCSVHKTCASKNATDSSTKSCIYTMGGFSGISKTADC